MTIIARRVEGALILRVRLPSRLCKGNNPMAHNDSDDKVDLAGEGLSADSQEPAAIEAAKPCATACSGLWQKSRTRDAAPNEAWRMRANTGSPTLRPIFCRS